jgi:hypothetical protein
MKEIELVNQIQPELSQLNNAELDELFFRMHEDKFEVVPPTIDEFIESEEYLGHPNIGLTVYPIWRKYLRQLHPSRFFNPYDECLIQGAIGIGKSLGLSTISMAYEVAKLLCFHEPQLHFKGISRTTTIVFMIFSANLTLAEGVNWEYMEAFLGNSPFFQRYVTLPRAKRLYDKGIDLSKGLRIEIGSNIHHALGKAVICAELDEANFGREKTSQSQQSYLGLAKRRQSRFMGFGGSVPGILFLISQPEHKDSFLQRRIDTVKQSSDIRTMIVENINVWEVKKHLGIYNKLGIPDLIDGTFKVFLGNDNQDPSIIYNESSFDPATLDGEVLDVPNVYLPSFEKDMLESIKQIAGRSAMSSINLIRSRSQLTNVMTKKSSRFKKEIITLDFYDKNDNIMKYLEDQNQFLPENIMSPHCYRFIHIDIGATRDRMGIACCFADSNEQVHYKTAEHVASSEKRLYFVDWLVAIQAGEKQEIPFNKVVEFILFLKYKLNYNVHLVTTDQREGGRQLRQDLNLQGVQSDYLSVDKTREPYITLRYLIQSRSIIMPKHQLLFDELINLRDDGVKVDHPPHSSKDLSDAVCGAVFNAYKAGNIFSPVRYEQRIKKEQEDKYGKIMKQAQEQNYMSGGIVEQFSKRYYG